MKKILIAEDDNILIAALVSALGQKHHVIMARDGEEALQKIQSEKPDLILLDLIMPKKTGEEVLEAVKKIDAVKDIPVLVLTVKVDDKSINRCIELGARGYFIKSHYTLDEISKKIESVLVG